MGKHGFLVTFEGGEGCGKSSQIKLFKEYLEQSGIEFVMSREPGGTQLAESLRDIVLHNTTDISPLTEFMIMSSARADHVEKVIKPALKQNKLVVLDRFYDSSYTYQGYAGGEELGRLMEITNIVTQGIEPDLTFLLDLSYEAGMARKMKDENLKNLDRMEEKGKEYFDKVRNGYLTLSKKYPNRFCVVDASKSIEEVAKIIISEFERRYK